MTEWIAETFEKLGYFGVALAMLLENVFPPIPSEAVLPAAGVAVRQGRLSLVGVILAATAGSLLGAAPWYCVGRWVGTERLRAWAERRGRWFGVSGNDVERADRWFERYGAAAVLFGRLMPGVRTLISVPAGLAEMGFVRFLLYTAAGSLGWNSALTLLGWWLGRDADRLTKGLSWLGVAVVVLLAAWIVRRIWRARRGRRIAEDNSSSEK